MSILEGFKVFKNGIENWFSVALNMFVLKRDVDCRIKNIGTAHLRGGTNYLEFSLFRALIFSNTKDLSKGQIENLKNYIDHIEDDIIEVINFEDGERFKFLNKEMTLIFETYIYGDYKEYHIVKIKL